MTIEELKAKSAETSERVAYLAKFLKIADHEDQIKALEETMAKPDFWDDKEKAQETVQKLSSEKNIVEPFHQLQKLFSEADSAGCILWSILDNRQLGIIESSRPPDYPLIFIDHKPEITARGFDFSGFDDFAAGKQLGQHLKQSGFSACSCCFQSRFADFSTNRNRLAGLSAGLGFEPEIFTAYSSRHSRPFQEYCHEVSHRGIPTALVLISEIDLPFFERMPPVDRENLTPYAFFTAVAPRCSGIQLPDGEMGRGAVELIAARRAGDTSFSLSRTFGGTLVGV